MQPAGRLEERLPFAQEDRQPLDDRLFDLYSGGHRVDTAQRQLLERGLAANTARADCSPEIRIAPTPQVRIDHVDADDVVLLNGRGGRTDAELHLPDLLRVPDNTLGQQEPGRQLEVGSGRAHGHVRQDRVERPGIADPNLERLLGRQPVRSLPAPDPSDRCNPDP